MLNEKQQQRLIELVREVAAREIRPRFRRLDPATISVKTSFDDLVTEVDIAVEDALSAAIPGILPGARILGEEQLSRGEGNLGWLSEPGVVVVIDPIDGTWNYARGVANHGVLLSVIESAVVRFGLLYDPILDDWIIANQGQGAWFEQADGTRSRVATSSDKTVDGMIGFMQPSQFAAEIHDAAYEVTKIFGRCSTLRCACHEYRLLAQGAVDFVVHARPTAWDFSAGALAVAEAGGAVGFLDGRDYSPLIDQGCLIATNSQASLDELRKRFTEMDLNG